MAASLSADERIWKACRYCMNTIWRYPGGQIWRDNNMNSACKRSMCGIHVPEYG
jgi:hypothetical protein